MIDFQKYEKAASQLNQAANSLWSKITFTAVSDVISNEVDARELDKICWDLKDKSFAWRRALSNEANALPEDEYFDKYEDKHIKTEDLFYAIDKKLNAIETIIDSLKEIQDKNEEDDFNSLFNVPKISIDESFIRIGRLGR